VALDLAADTEVTGAFSGATELRLTLSHGDGEQVEVLVGAAGDVLLRYGERAAFHVAPGGLAVICAPADPQALDWQRVLLDTVLGTAALCQGLEGLHAGAVELPGVGALAIVAAMGGGKTTLCAELVTRGARLFADDLVFVTRDGERILAHPGPPLMNVPRTPAAPDRLGTRVATFGEEDWIAVSDHASEPLELRMLVVLDRRSPGAEATIAPDSSSLPLMAAALDSGPAGDRRRARFELIADLARRTPVLRLSAGAGVPPSRLAELVESAAHAKAAP
jgi:hypothetical protein